MLNAQQARLLFESEAVLLGDHDGVPIFRAAELFGKKAAEFASEIFMIKNGQRCVIYSSYFGVGDYQCHYLTMEGFLVAASYANVEEVRAKDAAKAVET